MPQTGPATLYTVPTTTHQLLTIHLALIPFKSSLPLFDSDS